jgi:hypothetical protein
MHSKLQESSLRMEINQACGCKRKDSGQGVKFQSRQGDVK